MTRAPSDVKVGQKFATGGARLVWRVGRWLPDHVHVVLKRENDPSRIKTVSAWALLNCPEYVSVSEPPADA